MNKRQRTQISKLGGALRAALDDGMPLVELMKLIEGTTTQLVNLRDDEQDKLDNMPESLASSDKGDAMQEAIDNLDCAIVELEGIDPDEEDHEEVGRAVEAALDYLSELE
jgi:hypothetical protein